jgi:FMN phosphatase YigB (HAD superfamily)
MLKAVGFDLYGTLLTEKPVTPFSALFRRLARESTFRADVKDYVIALNTEDFGSVDALCRHFGVALPDGEIADFERRIEEDVASVRLLDGSTELLDAVLERKLRVFLISNVAYPYVRPVETLVDAMGRNIASRASAAVYSCRAGMSKPHRGPFILASSLLGIGPNEALYTGDKPTDVSGPRKIGMHAMPITEFRDRHREILDSMTEGARWENDSGDENDCLVFLD